MPGPLSVMTMSPPRTATLMCGATSASSQVSSALSINSFMITSGHSSTPWPVWLINSLREQNSSRREVEKVSRVSLAVLLVGMCFPNRRGDGLAAGNRVSKTRRRAPRTA
jgi:hypothetical protein